MRCPSECEIEQDGKIWTYRCVLQEGHTIRHGVRFEDEQNVSLLSWDDKGDVVWEGRLKN